IGCDTGRFGRYKDGGRFIGSRPSASHDERSVVVSLPSTGCGDLYAYDIEEKSFRRITDSPTYEGDPVFSPSGDRIAYVRERGGVGEIWIMNADGSNQRRLTSARHYDHGPTFVTQDLIVFSRNRTEQGTSAELCYLDLQTNDVRPLRRNGMPGYLASRVNNQTVACGQFN